MGTYPRAKVANAPCFPTYNDEKSDVNWQPKSVLWRGVVGFCFIIRIKTSSSYEEWGGKMWFCSTHRHLQIVGQSLKLPMSWYTKPGNEATNGRKQFVCDQLSHASPEA
jgi:hypothetical protein